MAEAPEAPPGQEKHLQYTWRGLKMVSDEKSIFELDEPIWHADDKVGGCTVLRFFDKKPATLR